MCKMLMLESDSPKVNKKVFYLMNEELKSTREKGLVDFGFCNIHMIHNAFQKGLEELGSDASDLILAIYYYFKDWPSRWEDFTKIQESKELPNKHFIKHACSRWLTIEPAAQRLIEQWEAVIDYFFKFIPLKQSRLLKTNGYKKIIPLLKKKSMKAELKFVCISASLFTNFTQLFQKHAPLIHLLHGLIKELVINIMGRICSKEALEKFKEYPFVEAFDVENLLPSDELILSDEMKKLISNLSSIEKKVSPSDEETLCCGW